MSNFEKALNLLPRFDKPPGGFLNVPAFARAVGTSPRAIRVAFETGRIDHKYCAVVPLGEGRWKLMIQGLALDSYRDLAAASGQTRGSDAGQADTKGGASLAGTKLLRERVKLESEQFALEEKKRNLVPTLEVAALFQKWNAELRAALQVFAEAAGRSLATPDENWVAARNKIARLLNPAIESWGIAVSETDSPAAAKLLDALAGLQNTGR